MAKKRRDGLANLSQIGRHHGSPHAFAEFQFFQPHRERSLPLGLLHAQTPLGPPPWPGSQTLRSPFFAKKRLFSPELANRYLSSPPQQAPDGVRLATGSVPQSPGRPMSAHPKLSVVFSVASTQRASQNALHPFRINVRRSAIGNHRSKGACPANIHTVQGDVNDAMLFVVLGHTQVESNHGRSRPASKAAKP